MEKITEPKTQNTKADFMIWPEKGLSDKEQEEIEKEIESAIDEEVKLYRCAILKSEGIRYWVAPLTSEQAVKVEALPKVRHSRTKILNCI